MHAVQPNWNAAVAADGLVVGVAQPARAACRDPGSHGVLFHMGYMCNNTHWSGIELAAVHYKRLTL